MLYPTEPKLRYGSEAMTRISQAQAREIRLLTRRKKKPVRISIVQWDAQLITGGVWIQIPFVPPTLNVWKDWYWAKQGRYKKDLIAASPGAAAGLSAAQVPVSNSELFTTTLPIDAETRWITMHLSFLWIALVKGGVLVDDNGCLVKVPR